MNYIGSKKTLLPFIYETIKENVNIKNKVFCDIFAGTGIVGRFFKNKTKKIISNDLEYYSYVLLKNYIGNEDIFSIPFIPEKKEGFIYNNYCSDESNRKYFSKENGRYIDGIRKQIENYKNNKNLYYFLLTSLLESADKVANTASVYGAFLKKIKISAQKKIDYLPYQPDTGKAGEVFNEDSNVLIKKIKGDILYIDPPYNQRQYGANYHILNTIAKNDYFTPQGITGLPKYNKSLYSKKNIAKDIFEDLIINSDFEYIFISYNNEGIIPLNKIQDILTKIGDYKLFVYDGYKRFKADNRTYSSNKTIEYLHLLIKK